MNRSPVARSVSRAVSRNANNITDIPFTPLALFAGGQPGVWHRYDDLDSLSQNSTGTTPVTANAQPVGRVLDQSGNGTTASQATAGQRPVYNTDGSYHWLTFDKSNDKLLFTVPAGGWQGSMLIATEQGTAIYGVNLPAGSYAYGKQYFPGAKVYAFLVRHGALTEDEKTELLAHTANSGAAADFSAVTNAGSFWEGWTELTEFPVVDLSGCYSFSYTWHGCTGLTSFPLLDMSNADYLGDTWSGCTGLTSFPAINTASVTNMEWAWDGCTALASFPLLDTGLVTSFKAAWRNCDGLTSFPLLNTASATTLESAWDDCDGLTSFPAINTANVTNFKFTWWGNTSLTSFPVIDTSKGTNFQGTWKLCSSLTSFPALNFAAGTNFTQTWMQCYDLTTFPANVFDNCLGTDFTSAFNDCSLTSQSVNNILISLDAAGQSNGTLGITGHNNAAPTGAGITAADNLVAKGWTLTLVGYPA